MKIIHIADVHWRGLSRHAEYTESFEDFFNKCRELNPDVIYVGGDIVHSKTQGISPELIDRLSWWFTSMAEICPVHVILGNHDGLQYNKDRQDAVSPIVSALDNPNIHLYKKSGVYPTGIDGFNWCVFSCFDEEGWKNVRPVPGMVNIALFHGAVWGSKTDIDWEIEGEVTVDLFESFDFSLLGDIHKRQFLNEKNTIAYCGSTIQQNYGEDPGKGFLFWDIESKDNFTYKFYEVFHRNPFVTIDWQGDVKRTLSKAAKYKNGSRFRIRSKNLITQADSQEISYRLRNEMGALETVFKNENQFDARSYQGKFEKNGVLLNLRDISTHKDLFLSYFKNNELTEEEKDDILDLIDRYFIESTSGEEILRNARWEIENIKFENLFSYGENNIVDFSNNPGITGIFGKNTKGKSSIIGSLMYCLFNTSDRGPIKNLHIINNRKNNCKASVEININGDRFRISRGTVKHTTRKGEVYASTSLDLKRVSSEGEEIEDLTEEQRRETEKVLRKLIGTSDDFLMTSLASQGGMNNFLSEGATSRKNILTKFLDLEVFDRMNELCKRDSSEIRSISRSIKKENWDKRKIEIKESIKEYEKKLELISERINLLRSQRDTLKEKKISNYGFKSECFTRSQVDKKKEELEITRENASDIILNIENLVHKREERLQKIKKIEDVCNSTEIEKIKEQRHAKIELEKNIIKLKNYKEKSEIELSRLKKSAEKLTLVPCGTKFPNCMFIKGSHLDKEKISSQIKIVESSIDALNDSSKSLEILNDINPDEKIKKYNSLILKVKDIENESLSISSDILSLSEKKSLLDIKISESLREIDKMEISVVENESDPMIQIQNKIDSIASDIESLEKRRVRSIEKIAEKKITLKNLILDCEKHEQIKRQMRIYDLFLQATSAKGIPTRIMMSRLPIINSEISNILQGVVDFTISLEADGNTNSMDVYIDYGDSKRVIELASGMEKMISSLAIRVALINTSSLTKTNMMIIDEGFGSLDANNLEACTRLLESLKKWFRNILIISHVDAIKDCVDNSIEITKKGKNSHVKFI